MTRAPRRRVPGILVRGLLLLAVFGCSSISGDADTPITIDVFPPSGSGISAEVEIGDTAVMAASALNQQGDTVPATFTWRTPDTTIVFLDTGTGEVTGKLAGTARVQALAGSLVSDFVTLTVVPRADTLVLIPPDSVRLLTADTASAPLVAELDSINPVGPTPGPLAGRRIIYEIIQIFPATTSATLNGGLLAIGTTTGAAGTPTVPVYVRKVPGSTHPDSVYVEIRSFRPSGAAIPGTGQRFIVRFDP